jgi:hypothetical protein
MRFRPKLSYANVMATIAVFIALGGASYAALKLPKNSVGAKQLKKNAVTGAKVKNHSLTGADIKVSKLGTVPSAKSATTAGVANSLAPSEGWHEVGTAGEPAFLNAWHNQTDTPINQTVAFFKDQEGIVHLRGNATRSSIAGAIFYLPPGYRPPRGKFYDVPGICFGGSSCASGLGLISIVGTDVLGAEGQDGAVNPPFESTIISLNGITFRAES